MEDQQGPLGHKVLQGSLDLQERLALKDLLEPQAQLALRALPVPRVSRETEVQPDRPGRRVRRDLLVH